MKLKSVSFVNCTSNEPEPSAAIGAIDEAKLTVSVLIGVTVSSRNFPSLPVNVPAGKFHPVEPASRGMLHAEAGLLWRPVWVHRATEHAARRGGLRDDSGRRRRS